MSAFEAEPEIFCSIRALPVVTQCMVRPCVARGFLRFGGWRSCINVSGLWLERLLAPGHHGYQRACDLISGQASTGQTGHQCSHAPGSPILHLVLSSRRPRREGVGYLISRSLFRAGGFCGYALTAIDLASKFRSRARTLQAMRASLLARAIASADRGDDRARDDWPYARDAHQSCTAGVPACQRLDVAG